MAEDWLHIGTYSRCGGASVGPNPWVELRINTAMVSLTPLQARETAELLLRAAINCEATKAHTLVEIPSEEDPE